MKKNKNAEKRAESNYLAFVLLFCISLANAQQNTYNAVSDEEEKGSDGLGMAEVIAIIVCGLIIFAFLLACCVMVRNA